MVQESEEVRGNNDPNVNRGQSTIFMSDKASV